MKKYLLSISAALTVIYWPTIGVTSDQLKNKLSELSCSEVTRDRISRWPDSFDSELIEWDEGNALVLKKIVRQCYGGKSPDSSDTSLDEQFELIYSQRKLRIANLLKDRERSDGFSLEIRRQMKNASGLSSLVEKIYAFKDIDRKIDAMGDLPDRKQLRAELDTLREAAQERVVELAAVDERERRVKEAERAAKDKVAAAERTETNATRAHQVAEQARRDAADREKRQADRLKAEIDAQARIEAASRAQDEADKRRSNADNKITDARAQQDAARKPEEELAVQQRQLAESNRQKEDALSNKTKFNSLKNESKLFLEQRPIVADKKSASDLLVMFYTADIAFRVCREKFGKFDREVKDAQSATKSLEDIIITLHDIPASDVALMRQNIGIDSGRGPLVNQLRMDTNIFGACQELVSMLDLAHPLKK